MIKRKNKQLPKWQRGTTKRKADKRKPEEIIKEVTQKPATPNRNIIYLNSGGMGFLSRAAASGGMVFMVATCQHSGYQRPGDAGARDARPQLAAPSGGTWFGSPASAGTPASAGALEVRDSAAPQDVMDADAAAARLPGFASLRFPDRPAVVSARAYAHGTGEQFGARIYRLSDGGVSYLVAQVTMPMGQERLLHVEFLDAAGQVAEQYMATVTLNNLFSTWADEDYRDTAERLDSAETPRPVMLTGQPVGLELRHHLVSLGEGQDLIQGYVYLAQIDVQNSGQGIIRAAFSLERDANLHDLLLAKPTGLRLLGWGTEMDALPRDPITLVVMRDPAAPLTADSDRFVTIDTNMR
jgi:hypothetical protein